MYTKVDVNPINQRSAPAPKSKEIPKWDDPFPCITSSPPVDPASVSKWVTAPLRYIEEAFVIAKSCESAASKSAIYTKWYQVPKAGVGSV